MTDNLMKLSYGVNRVISNRQSASLFNAITVQTVPGGNLIGKTNAQIMKGTLTNRK